jgi:hypothetical protein
MANVSRINGFRPIGHQSGAPWNGKVNKYWIAAADGTATFVGDIVSLGPTADADGTAGAIQATASSAPLGPIVWMEPNPNDLMQNYRPASQNIASQAAGRWVYVADSPDLVMEVQEDAVGGALALASVGLNAQPIVGAGSTTTGQSGMQLDTSTAAVTATHTLRILGFIQRPDNEVGVANAKVKVGFNVHQYGSVGVLGIA